MFNILLYSVIILHLLKYSKYPLDNENIQLYEYRAANKNEK
jgi:hypothetical protein